MCPYFKNKYVIGSKRYPGFDYSAQGKYFITICTKNKIPCFGNIENGIMILSDLGNFLLNEWLKTPSVRPDMNIILDEFVIMPDHFHAIITIGENQFNRNINPVNQKTIMHREYTGCCRNAMHGVSTNQNNQYHNEFRPQLKNLSSIIRGIKSVVTTYARKYNMDFQWQPRYYDHIIRSHPAKRDKLRQITINDGTPLYTVAFCDLRSFAKEVAKV